MRTFNKIVIILMFLAFSVASNAQDRQVYVNGEFLSNEQITALEYMSSGYVQDGAYWVDWQSGAWGMGNDAQVQGYLDLSLLNNSADNSTVASSQNYNDTYDASVNLMEQAQALHQQQESIEMMSQMQQMSHENSMAIINNMAGETFDNYDSSTGAYLGNW